MFRLKSVPASAGNCLLVNKSKFNSKVTHIINLKSDKHVYITKEAADIPIKVDNTSKKSHYSYDYQTYDVRQPIVPNSYTNTWKIIEISGFPKNTSDSFIFWNSKCCGTIWRLARKNNDINMMSDVANFESCQDAKFTKKSHQISNWKLGCKKHLISNNC